MDKNWSTGKVIAVTLGGMAAAAVLGISFLISLYQLKYFMVRVEDRHTSRHDERAEVIPEQRAVPREQRTVPREERAPEETEEAETEEEAEDPFFTGGEEYYVFANDIHGGLSYDVEFLSYLKDDFAAEGAGSVLVEFSYPHITGDVQNLDGINETLQEEIWVVEEYVASSYAPYLSEGEEFVFEGECYVTYMSEDILSVIYVEYGYLDGSFMESYVVSYNVDMEMGIVLNNTHLLAVDDGFSVDFRERCKLQNGEIEELEYMSDQEITYYLTDNDYLIVFYTPLGMEVGFNYYEGWVTVTYKDYEKYQEKF